MTIKKGFAWFGLDTEKVLALVEKSGLSQLEIAKDSGFSVNHLNNLIHGRKDCTRTAAIALAHALGVDLDDIEKAPEQDTAPEPMPPAEPEQMTLDIAPPGTVSEQLERVIDNLAMIRKNLAGQTLCSAQLERTLSRLADLLERGGE